MTSSSLGVVQRERSSQAIPWFPEAFIRPACGPAVHQASPLQVGSVRRLFAQELES